MQQKNESSSKNESRRAKNDHNLIPVREKDSDLKVIFAKKELTFKQHKDDFALREIQIPQDLQQHTDLAVDVNTDQLEQKSDCTHEMKENAEPLHVILNTSSINTKERPFQEESYEINNFQQIEQNMKKHNKKQIRGIVQLHVLCINIYKRSIN